MAARATERGAKPRSAVRTARGDSRLENSSLAVFPPGQEAGVGDSPELTATAWKGSGLSAVLQVPLTPVPGPPTS
jgi:hypothetical protein